MKGFRWFFCACVELTNGPFLSKRLKRFSTSKVSKPFIPLFIRTFNINKEEIHLPTHKFNSLHSFFIRELKPNSRLIDQDASSVVSPVDGVLAEQGHLDAGKTFVVKGQTYSLSAMLGSEETAEAYENGQYAVFYLSPSHYHRFHAPLSGTVSKRWSLGSRSYPVNQLGMTYGKKPLSGNYRVISEVNTEDGHKMAMVKVGAMNINSIELTHTSEHVEKGEEVGYFSFGSTVVLIWDQQMIHFTKSQLPTEVKMGEKVGNR
ncbi:phosphatidylserine decarboxylase [Alkalicoccobacillus gibsonii]|uniref:phosphatidylserine decarboxylase n=1 Tax=Alkalicoccobacillus gibsonii TaxID=79881 RepID=UPI0035183256